MLLLQIYIPTSLYCCGDALIGQEGPDLLRTTKVAVEDVGNRVFTLELQTSPHEGSRTQQSGAEGRKHIQAGVNCLSQREPARKFPS